MIKISRVYIIVGAFVLFFLIVAIKMYFTFNEGLKYGEAIHDSICTVQNSHEMARITLCDSGREFSLTVEKADSLGNSNFDIISLFIQQEETQLIKMQDSKLVRLVHPDGSELKLIFDNTGGDLVNG